MNTMKTKSRFLSLGTTIYRPLIVFLFMLLCGSMSRSMAQNNKLSIPDIRVAMGKNVNIPVNLDNSNEIVGIQFTLQIPEGTSLNTSTAMLTERVEDHTVVVNPIAATRYMVMVFSPTNKPFKARTGTLMTIELLPTNLSADTEYDMTLTDVVLGAANGDNLLTEVSTGKIFVSKGADLEVSNVQTSTTSVSPGQEIPVSWLVKNIGEEPLVNGWKEQLYLENTNGNSLLLGTLYYDGTLAAGGFTSRTASFSLPTIVGFDNNAKVRVKLTPYSDSGEPSGYQKNNETSSNAEMIISKMLYISPEQTNIEEKRGSYIRYSLSRSGSRNAAEVYTITATGDSRLALPETVTIPAGDASTYFYAQVTPNNRLDDEGAIRFTVSGNGYPVVEGEVNIEDDVLPSLKLTPQTQELIEGGSVVFTVEAERASSQDVVVNLTCDFPSRFRIPSSIIIPSGQTRVEVTVEAVEDNIPDIVQAVTFTAAAAGYNPASENVFLSDNDVPTLQLQLAPNAVSEAAGPLAVSAVLKRTDNIDKLVTVKLSDDSNGGIYYGRQSIEMAAGVEEVTVNLGPIDNSIVDGERTYNISAAVFIASCRCNAENGSSGGVVTVPLTIYDNDGPTLTMSASSSILKEGGQMDVTIRRNTDTSVPLDITLGSDHDTQMEYPSVVTIPVGKAEVVFTVKSKKNDITGDGFIATLTAEAAGYAKGNIWFTVSDQTLPDAQVAEISVSDTEVEVGGIVTVNLSVTNTGSFELAEATKVDFYVNNQSAAVATAYLQTPLAAGESVIISREITMPESIGSFNVYAVVNGDQAVKELLYTNNTSNVVSVKTISPFSISLQVDKVIYNQGESVTVKGHVTGRDTGNKEVEVYVINEGYRHTLKAVTDNNGDFTASYQPYAGQMGHFVAGACYPGEGLTTEMASFDVFGVKRTTNDYIKCETLLGETFTGNFSISNPGILLLSDVKVEVVSKPDNFDISFACPSVMDGGTSADIEFIINASAVSEGDDWQLICLNITSAEGASLPVTLYCYCRNMKGQLKASVSDINTTMSIDSSREYPFVITNVGKGETGKITLNLPSWMSSVTPREMASLATGDSATVVLRFTSNAHMQLNVPVTGSLALNCENGDGLAINYYVEPVSEKNGNLQVDVCDEYTYYTEEAPHVSNAQVYVKHPYTGVIIAEGITGEDGIYMAELPEGYYKLEVRADKHESYSNFCYVNAGRTESIKINLSYQPITVTWDVVETEVVDEYQIQTTVKYETNVPMPVVKIQIPERIDGDNMAVGDVTMIYMTLTNIGHIRADNVTIVLPTDMTEWKFDALAYNEPFNLDPSQSVVAPILITRIADEGVVRTKAKSNLAEDYNNCMAAMRARYEYMCGEDIKNNAAAERLAMKFCAYAATAEAISEMLSGFGGGGPGSPGGGGGTAVGPNVTYNEVHKGLDICDPCDAERIEKIIAKGLSYTWIAPFDAGIDAAIKAAQDKHNGAKIIIRETSTNVFWSYVTSIYKGKFKIVKLIYDVVDVAMTCKNTSQQNAPRKASQHSWVDEFDRIALDYVEQLKAMDMILLYSFGDRFWYEELDQEKLDFLEYVSNLPEDYIPTDEELMQNKPEAASLEQARAYVNYVNGNNPDELPSEEEILAQFDIFKHYQETAQKEGFMSMTEKFDDAYKTYCKHYEEMKSSSVCASITLGFSQTMVMTRQAFRGTLTVYNGNETTAMTDVKLTLTVKDEAGNVATSHEFQIDPETLAGFEGELSLTDGWTLGAHETGTATIMFIPTKYAAPTTEEVYQFGGSLSYIDPYTGLEVTRTLTPIPLTVKPSPNLDLTYFMQRDIKGDDPLTDVIEPSEEAEFSLLINNIGYGDANNVMMVTDQPKIIDNEKGLLIDFELMSSQLNGGDKTLALGQSVATDFGTIPAMSTAYAQWWIKSSLLGHFVDYDVKATHVTSHGNPDLTLLNEVTIHELIRSITVNSGDNTLVGFMVNDITDAEDTPDMLYLSNGEIETVAKASGVNIVKTSVTDYVLTVQPSAGGWNYGNVVDPTYGLSKLESVTRQSDGKEMPLRNFWQTDRTLRDGKDPLYENRIHFADDYAGGTETYLLKFEPTPSLFLDIVAIEGVPTELSTTPVSSLTVVFNKYINPETFTADDLSLAVQGVKMDASLIGISTEDNKTFKLDFTELNGVAGNGYYVLTVQTSDIVDQEGFQGKNGKSVGWVMFADGMVKLKTSTYPEAAGTVAYSVAATEGSDASGNGNKIVAYGSKVVFSTVAEPGYEFKNWVVNGESVSTAPQLEYTVLGDMDVVANYGKLNYLVTVEAENGGTIEGNGTGVYNHGEELTFKALPKEDYVFVCWKIDEKEAGTNETLSVVLDKPIAVTAVFARNIYEQTLKMYRGWNWISSYLKEPLDINAFGTNANRIVGQFDELVYDPIYGLVGDIESLTPGSLYKVNMSYATTKTFKGHLHDINESPIVVKQGWNWIAYPYFEERPVVSVIENAEEGDFIISQAGFSEFANGYWEGTLDVLTPGNGYIYKSVSDKTLSFVFSTVDSEAMMKTAKATSPLPFVSAIDIHRYPNTMNMIMQLQLENMELSGSNYRIYAMAGEEYRGISHRVGEHYYMTVYGNEEIPISFVVQDEVTGNVYKTNESLVFSDRIVGTRKSPYKITIGDATGILLPQSDNHKVCVYTINGILIDAEATSETIEKLPKGVYIINGQKYIVR